MWKRGYGGCFILKGIESRTFFEWVKNAIMFHPVSSSKELKVYGIWWKATRVFVMFHPQRNWKIMGHSSILNSNSSFHPQRNWKLTVPFVSITNASNLFHPQRNWKSISWSCFAGMMILFHPQRNWKTAMATNTSAFCEISLFHPQRNWKSYTPVV